MTYYRQCKLRKGQIYYTTWLPEEFAKEGKYVKLRKNRLSGCIMTEGKWDDGWLVEEVYETRKPENYILEHERDYKTQRKASDI